MGVNENGSRVYPISPPVVVGMVSTPPETLDQHKWNRMDGYNNAI